MAYVEYQTPQGALGYETTEQGIILIAYRGKDLVLDIPDTIDCKEVYRVAKKTFLSAKTVKELKLPDTVRYIDDFAFAFCNNLEVIHIPQKVQALGIGIFKDCIKLKEIRFSKANHLSAKEHTDYASLLAATVGILDAPYLFDMNRCGSEEWLAHWDMRMGTIMKVDDTDGYSKLLLCGEEDYGSNENDLDLYIANNRKAKCRLAMLRLMHDVGLEENKRNELISYLQSHTKLSSSEECWQVVLEEHGDEKEYYEFMTSYKCIHESNIQAVLDDMGDRHAEMKVYLLRYQDEHWNHAGGGDFFDELEL